MYSPQRRKGSQDKTGDYYTKELRRFRHSGRSVAEIRNPVPLIGKLLDSGVRRNDEIVRPPFKKLCVLGVSAVNKLFLIIGT